MKISPVLNNFSKKNNQKPSFGTVYIDPKFLYHSGINGAELKKLQNEVFTLEAENPHADCFIRRGHYGDFTHATYICFSERIPCRRPNKPNIIGMQKYDILTADRDYPEVEYPTKFNCKKDPKNAVQDLVDEIKEGFDYIAVLVALKKEISAKNPNLKGYKLVEAVDMSCHSPRYQ